MTLKQQIIKLLEKNTDPIFHTTDFDRFALEVIKLVYAKKRPKKTDKKTL